MKATFRGCLALVVMGAMGSMSAGQMVVRRWGTAPKGALQVIPCQNGQGVARFDLSGLPKGVKVYRADLLVFRTALLDGNKDEATADIEVYPLFAEAVADREPKVSGRPLAIRPPWFDCLDATEAVSQWAAGKTNGGFFVKVCPLWDAEATCLDVYYEGGSTGVSPVPLKTTGGTPVPPPQVTEVKAVHRAGQTFITWKELDEPVGKDEVAWGELKGIMGDLDRKGRTRYAVYRSDKPVTAKTLPEAEPIATVSPLSCWNVNGRNIERPIDIVIATKDVLMTGQWNPFGSASTEGDYGRDCPIDRLVVQEGQQPLPRGTGLYVHTGAAKGKAYYAVVSVADGVQNTLDLSDKNVVGPIEESPGDPQPVLQGELPRMPMFNYRQKRLHYVHWAAPPHVNVPSQYYNWSVGVPDDLGKDVPLELNLHRDGDSYWRTQFRIETDSIVLCPYDFPVKTWWYGYHESYGTLRSFKGGTVQPYTERRLLAFVDWAARKWPVDRKRILVSGCRGGAGGSGPLHLALRHPEVFNVAIAGHPLVEYAGTAQATDKRSLATAQAVQAIWGKLEWSLKTDSGKSVWDEHDLVKLLAETPARTELPLVAMTSNHGYVPCRDFYKAMLEGGRGIIGEFQWGGGRYIPVSRSGTFPNVIRLDVRKDLPLLAFGSAEAVGALAKMGEFNRNFRWRDIVEEPGRFEATVWSVGRGAAAADITLRRLGKFKVEPGKAYAWEYRPAAGKPEPPKPDPKARPAKGEPTGPQQGEAAANKDGLLTIQGVKVGVEPGRLVVAAK